MKEVVARAQELMEDKSPKNTNEWLTEQMDKPASPLRFMSGVRKLPFTDMRKLGQ